MVNQQLEKEDDQKQDSNFDQQLYDKEFLITEYTQTGEEFRYRDKLLHNSYYLLIIASILIVGNGAQELRNGNRVTLAMIGIAGGVSFLLIGAIVLNHYIQRRSAEALRTRTEQFAEGIRDEPVQRPLSIQFWVIGNNSEITGKRLKKANTFWEEVFKFPNRLYSAKTVAFSIFVLGILQLLTGFALLANLG